MVLIYSLSLSIKPFKTYINNSLQSMLHQSRLNILLPRDFSYRVQPRLNYSLFQIIDSQRSLDPCAE
jgi:hypothetical protein